ncbi:SusD/RagB family nutrient-binding outer membrane lipoprotein [Halalkalibaculum sp. DA3122]|uniref:SusD/RagB family nutrient-binding outer membrane lipoprotein n=1 Tax=Halalkalibaculum sp. DA3122 TaxID=3373607 RepID=UPI003754C98C
MKNLIFKKVSATFFALVLLFSAGCSDFLDINEDPNAATEVEGDLLFPTALGYIASNRAIEIGPSNTLWAQIWSSNGSTSVFTDSETYAVSSFMTGNTWSFYYVDVLKNLELVRQQAESADPVRNNVAAQAKILQSYVFYELTVLFGAVPYTEAVDSEISQPNFDDQETILRGLVTDLTEAVDQIEIGSELAGVTDGDLIYKGDMAKWEKFGNSLKLRILMLIRNKDNSVDSEIADLLENEPLIRTNADNAEIPFFNETNNANNLWKLNNQFAGFVNAGNGNGYLFAGDPLVSLMKDLGNNGDPRLGTYFEYAVDFDDGTQQTSEYFGQEAGVFDYNDGETSMLSQNIIRQDWPSRIVTASEVLFYEAEYYANQGDLDAAEDSYEAGIRASMDYFDDKPGSIPDSERDDYINALDDLSTLGQTQALEDIHEQQYIDVFEKAPENWTQWRRVKVPDLPVPQNALLGNIIRRFPYPPDELSANPNAPSRPSNDTPMWFEN